MLTIIQLKLAFFGAETGIFVWIHYLRCALRILHFLKHHQQYLFPRLLEGAANGPSSLHCLRVSTNRFIRKEVPGSTKILGSAGVTHLKTLMPCLCRAPSKEDSLLLL